MLAEGGVSTVWKAINLQTGLEVAIKQTSSGGSEENLKRTVREIKLLRFFNTLDNVVTLYDVFSVGPAVNQQVFLVLELVETDLGRVINNKTKKLGLPEVKSITHQLLLVLRSLHRCHVVHRDLKPENVLLTLSEHGFPKVKLCDFGTGRYKPPVRMNLSSLLNVTTLYYCPPEGILSERRYETSVDLWALGCILVEMITREPLISVGWERSLEKSLLNRMVEICGKPSEEELSSYQESTYLNHIKTLPAAPPLLDQLLTSRAADANVLPLARSFLQFNPEKRITAEGALKHPFFTDCPQPKENHLQCPEYFSDPLYETKTKWTDLLQQELTCFAG
uniref:Protein kinase domain-containing protein n=1 Tax=Arcella intermedia TaxID=1963864 RepID=A0A6B2L8L6_9EUKA